MKRIQIRTRRPRRGFFSMELVLTLPILGVVLFALFEFSLLFSARGEIVEAARVGARTACLPGAEVADVEDSVRRVLGPRLRDNVYVDVQLGDHSGDLVAVAVHVPMEIAAPDLLWPIGYSIRDRQLFSETRMIRE